MHIKQIHHVAYRCIDARQTVEWYGRHLDMAFVLAIAEDRVPSTGALDPYMHVFLDAGHGNLLAFFELPNQAPMQRDHATPDWVQHLALEVDSVAQLLEMKTRLLAAGIDVLGPVDHTLFRSISAVRPPTACASR
jgi:catechol 2,3-dioxygenase-like lactoylglutathione lyase family enzyme